MQTSKLPGRVSSVNEAVHGAHAHVSVSAPTRITFADSMDATAAEV